MQGKNNKKSNFFERLSQIIDYYGIKNVKSFACDYLGYDSSQKINRLKDENTSPSYEILNDISNKFENINSEWLLTGRGEMLKSNAQSSTQKKLIPVYDINTMGGVNEISANMEGESKPAEWIDTGDWFSEATSAIHHYGDSMLEYPSGCILALRDIYDFELIVWGKNYVIETDEYRITKRLQRGSISDIVIAYSSNEEKYQDGTLIHEPFDIPKKSIRRLALVLGYVVKEQSSGKVYNIRKK